MFDTLEFILVVMVVVLFYWLVIWNTTKNNLRILEGKKRLSEAVPSLLAEAAFFGTTFWGFISLIFGDGYSDNPAAPLPAIALLSMVFAAGTWLLSIAIILTYNWLSSLWLES